MTARVPFAERGGRLRGVLDLATGCYPAFLFGGSLGSLLPAFHFHDVTREWLAPRLQFLADNGYRGVACDEIARLVIDGTRPAPRSVALVGASPRRGSVGRAILGNIRKANFRGEFGLVNQRYVAIDGVATTGSLSKLAFAPELVVITAPARAIPGLVDEAVARPACLSTFVKAS